MTRTNDTRSVVWNVAVLAAALGLWVGLVVLFAAPIALTGSVSWRQAVGFGASFWAPWLIFLPAVAWLGFRLPLERGKVLQNLSLHVLACLLVVACGRATLRALNPLTPRPVRLDAPGQPPPPLDRSAARLPPPGSFGPLMGFRAALDVLVYGALLGGCQAITYFVRLQERDRREAELEARLTTARLQALRMQLHPHFLFNTLNSIAALVYVNPRAADEMLGDLGGLLRRSLDSMEEHEVPLARELEFIDAYVGIEQKRFGDRLRVERSIPAELLNALVPALLLQPLVENAIRHGIEPRRDPGVISIEVREVDSHLHLRVRDDGRGLSGVDSAEVLRPGIGLANTQARLRGLYGGDQSFSLGKAQPHGCQVDIRIPLRRPARPAPAASSPPSA